MPLLAYSLSHRHKSPFKMCLRLNATYFQVCKVWFILEPGNRLRQTEFIIIIVIANNFIEGPIRLLVPYIILH